jgi:DNA-directed RNA polymerase sigma subunit (sigma70/sigma32)
LLDIKAIAHIEKMIYIQCLQYYRTRIEQLDELNFFKGLELLSLREQKYLRYRFLEMQTIESAASKFKVSRERVRQIEQKALKRLNNIN